MSNFTPEQERILRNYKQATGQTDIEQLQQERDELRAQADAAHDAAQNLAAALNAAWGQIQAATAGVAIIQRNIARLTTVDGTTLETVKAMLNGIHEELTTTPPADAGISSTR